MKRKKVFQVNTELFKITGIQRVLLDIHEALKQDFESKIVSNIPFKKIHPSLGITENDFIQLRNPLMFRNSVVIIHERKMLPMMWIMTHIPGLNIKCIYVHHNELYGNKMLSLFPKNIVAISNAGIRNLTEYFGVAQDRITKIHNCVRESDSFVLRDKTFNPNDIKIIYPARINKVKQQTEIVRNLKGKLDSRVKIMFAGTGPLFGELKNLCRANEQFHALGFRDDISALMNKCDFTMLFSTQEGLPISLIESIQMGLPAICNNVGGNIEIISDNENGFIVNNWDELLRVLNSLPEMPQVDIKKMRSYCRKKYLEEFTFTYFKYKYLSLLNSIYGKA